MRTLSKLRWTSSISSTTQILEATTVYSPRRRLANPTRSEEHTSELQSRLHLVCRLLLEKKKNSDTPTYRLNPAIVHLMHLDSPTTICRSSANPKISRPLKHPCLQSSVPQR